MRGSEFEDFSVWTLIDFHPNRILDATLMDHTGEHGRSNRATAETRGHDADFGFGVFVVPCSGLKDELQVHLFHPWAVAIAQRTIELIRPGVVLRAYAGDVIAVDAVKTSEVGRVYLIVQDADIGDVLRIFVLVVTGAIETGHEQAGVWILLTDQQRRLELRQLMAAVCICRQVLRRCWIRFHVIRPCLCIGMLVAHYMLPGEDAISRFWCMRGSGRCGNNYPACLDAAEQMFPQMPAYTH